MLIGFLKHMVEKYSEIRNELKDIANSSKTSFEEKMEARRKLDLLSNNLLIGRHIIPEQHS